MAEKLKYVRGSGNIFVDLGFAKAEAENLKMRADLMIRIVQFYEKSGMTQAAAAKALGLTQPRLNALLRGKIGQFSLDADAAVPRMTTPCSRSVMMYAVSARIDSCGSVAGTGVASRA